MPTFRYKAYASGGRENTGAIEAESPKEAMQLLRQQGLYATEVAPSAGKLEKVSIFRRGITLPERSLMTRRLATLVGASVPLYEAMTTLYEQESEGELKRVISRIRDRLAQGSNLASAMAAEPSVFSESYISMVAAGEAGGALEIILERLADFLEDQQAVQSRITTALAYPILMMVVGVGVMLFLLAFVIPKIIVIFEQSKAALPLITVLLIKTSNLVRSGWWALLILAATGVYAYRKLMKSEAFHLKRDRFFLRLPVAGNLLTTLVLSRFARVLGLLLTSGVPVIRATEITGDVVVNRVYRAFLHGVRERLAEGSGLSGALKSSSLFPPLLVHMIAVGEKGGELEQMLLKAGTAYEKEFDTAITRSMALLEPFLVLGMGLAVGIVVLAVLLPIFQLNQLVK
jgi:general secretion pathway protein F